MQICQGVFTEMEPSLSINVTLFVKTNYIISVLVPEGIVKAIQILHACGCEEASQYFRDIYSEEEKELELLETEGQQLTKNEERSVNRRACLAAQKLGVKTTYTHADMYETSDEDY